DVPEGERIVVPPDEDRRQSTRGEQAHAKRVDEWKQEKSSKQDEKRICARFDPPPALAPVPLLDPREVRTTARGHGRSDELRHLVASTDLTGYLDWPGVAQVVRLRRTWREHGTTKQALLDAITSLSPKTGPPARLLALRWEHW